MERTIKYGTYPVTLPAGSWQEVLVALGAARDEYYKLGLNETAESYERVRKQVYEQVTEETVR